MIGVGPVVLGRVLMRSLELVARDSLGPDAPEREVAALMLRLFNRGAASLMANADNTPAEREMFAQIAEEEAWRFRSGRP